MHGTFDRRPEQNVAIALVEWGGLYAVLERKKKNRLRWTFPGGKVKEGETLLEAVVRETQEEAGLYILPYKKLGVVEKSNEIRHYYAAKALWGRLHCAEPDKFASAQWMAAQEIVDTFGDRLSPFVRVHFDRILKPKYHQLRMA